MKTKNLLSFFPILIVGLAVVIINMINIIGSKAPVVENDDWRSDFAPSLFELKFA